MINRMQNRLAKVTATLGNAAASIYVTAAGADVSADDALRELGIVLGERDQHVHVRKFFDAGPAKLLYANGVSRR